MVSLDLPFTRVYEERIGSTTASLLRGNLTIIC